MPRKATEKHDVKATVYLTQVSYDAAQDLARLNRLTFPQYIEKLINADIEANAENLRKFHELIGNV